MTLRPLAGAALARAGGAPLATHGPRAQSSFPAELTALHGADRRRGAGRLRAAARHHSLRNVDRVVLLAGLATTSPAPKITDELL